MIGIANMDQSLTALERAWHELAEPYHCRMTRSAFLEGIVNRYSEEWRAYHTLRHIGEMLEIIEEYHTLLADYDAVAFATWFHDIVYDPRAEDNEVRSATLARRILSRLQVPSRVINRAAELILMTTAHNTADSSFDTRLFIDADLSILGATPERYEEYRRDIRREYSWLSDQEYRQGRAEVLRRFLDRRRIFQTEELHERLEAQARGNLMAELESLTGKIE
jgi:predicted metal-dependent HD superfamily phosphohydrolase